MRQIKFRAWDGTRMLYSENGQFYLMQNGIQIPSSTGHEFYDKQYHVMQFTGLLDKNGVEIYEGDIVKFKRAEQGAEDKSYDVIRPIYFYCGAFMYDSVPLSQWSHENGLVANGLTTRRWIGHGANDLYMVDFDIEVIGNIHQHKDLL